MGKCNEGKLADIKHLNSSVFYMRNEGTRLPFAVIYGIENLLFATERFKSIR